MLVNLGFVANVRVDQRTPIYRMSEDFIDLLTKGQR